MTRTRQAALEKNSPKATAGVGDPPNIGQFALLSTTALTPHPHNPRRHTREQIRAIAKSIEAFGFNAPILIDKNRQILAGHGRWEAAKLSA